MRDTRRTNSVALATDGATAASRSGDSGFGLVEVIVAMTLFMLIAATTTPALLTAATFAESNDNRVTAASIAAAQIDQARAHPTPASLQAGPPITISQNGTTFTVTRALLVDASCAPPAAGGLVTITITVDWPGGAVHSDTLRAC